jgi:hypothetical protein
MLVTGHAEITLTDLQNHKATVEIVEASPTEISFTMQGRKGSLKMEQLSEESRTAAIEYAKSKKIFRTFPALTIQVKIAYLRRNSAETWYEKNVKLNSSVVIEGVKKIGAIPAAEASLVLITHDTKEKYVKHVEKMKIFAAETISIPDGATGDRREFSFQTVEMTFDSARDPTNVGGDEYKYFIFGLRDPVTKQLIEFQTNSAKVQNYVAKHPEARETLLAARKGAPFAEDFPQ